MRGTLRNFNTIEEFKQCDKAKLAQEVGEQVRYLSRSFLRISDLNSYLFQIWSQVNSEQNSSEETTLETLNQFLMITFADLKKYKYYYWTCFPALVQKPGWELDDGAKWESVELPNDVVRSQSRSEIRTRSY